MSIHLRDLLHAAEWGDGYCLACGEKHFSVEPPNATPCDACNALAVLPAQMILDFPTLPEGAKK